MAEHSSSTRAIPPSLTSAPRKPNPSPLQVSQISTPTAETFAHVSPKNIDSPHSSRGAVGTSPFTPRSPHYSPVFLPDRGDSLNEGDLSFERSRDASQELLSSDAADKRKVTPLATPKGNELDTSRTASAALQPGSILAESPPLISSEIRLAKARVVDHRPVERLGPRTSSIDSTMSSVSSTTSHSHGSPDPLSPNPSEIAQMIQNAGSSEALIRQLVKDRKQQESQNAQLWRIINKQRTLLMGLNTDLTRAMEEKVKYQKRYRELSARTKPRPGQRLEEVRKASPSGTTSSAAGSDDELPIQRHSVLNLDSQRELDEKAALLDHGADSTANNRVTTILNPVQAPSSISSSTTSPSFSSESMPKASPESETSDRDDDVDSRRNTIMQSHFEPIAPLEIHKKPPSMDHYPAPGTPPANELEMGPSPTSFSARRSFTTPRKSTNNSPKIGTDLPVESQATTSPVLRKGPPAPLNLQQRHVQPPQPAKSPEEYGPEDHSESEYEEGAGAAEASTFERGRKKTREEDDREREYIIQKEAESRSQSKKEKRSKSGSKTGLLSPASKHSTASPAQSLPKSPAIRAFSPNDSPTSVKEHFSPHQSLAGVLSGPSSSANSIIEQSITLSPPPASPGLPRSPRPVDRPLNSPNPRAPVEPNVASPPLSPHAGTNTLSPPVLSPRAPRHPIPLPPHTPNSLASPPHSTSEEEKASSLRTRSPALQPAPQSPPKLQPAQSPKSPAQVQVQALSPKSPKSPEKATSAPLAPISSNNAAESMPGGIYRDLVPEAHPELLLAPNALPLIQIKVISSRLRPSRHSMLSMKSIEEDPVFTLGVTARSDMKQLWRVEKPIMSLPQLDRELKQVRPFEFKLPDRSLFTGHAPAKIDARREALEKYFEDVLDTEMDDKAGLVLCQFLSTQVVPVEDSENTKPGGASEVHIGPDGRIVKEGYLTKRGKNFGGWKARYFVLDEPVLRYYESPGGALLGTIKLMKAQIGRQAPNQNAHSPSRGGDEHDKEFRHAFLILEPKRKDSTSVVRHVLCAENDEERDEWVSALFQYIGKPAPEKSSKAPSRNILAMMRSGKEESPAATDRGHDDSSTLQGVSYEDTVAGQPVKLGPSKDTASPIAGSFGSNHGMMQPSKAISGPTNATVIQDAAAWGNHVPDSPKVRDKEKKKSTFWGFGGRQHEQGSNMPAPQPVAPRLHPPNTHGKQVFGMPLAEAVEMFPARGTDLALPAIVYRSLEYLEAKEAANEEGIFRLSGSTMTIKQLRERFNNEGDVDLLSDPTHYDVHAVASLLKAYLRELPNTVLGSREMHIQFVQVLESDDKARKIAAYNVLVHHLPLPNWTLIRALSAFLIGVVNNSQLNKMTVRNVGIVFSPTLNVPPPIFASFLTDFDAIFGTPPPRDQRIPLSDLRTQSQERRPPFQQKLSHSEDEVRKVSTSSSIATSHANSWAEEARARSSTPDSKRDDSRTRPSYSMGRKASNDSQSHGHISSQQQTSQQQFPHNLSSLHSTYDAIPHPQATNHQRPPFSQTYSSSSTTSSILAPQQPAPSVPLPDPPNSSSSQSQSHSKPPSSGLSIPHSRSGPIQRESQAPGLGSTSVMRDVKARRRESSRMLMNMGPAAGSAGMGVAQVGGLMGGINGLGGPGGNGTGGMGGNSLGGLGGNHGLNGGAMGGGQRKSSMPTMGTGMSGEKNGGGGGRNPVDRIYDENNIRI